MALKDEDYEKAGVTPPDHIVHHMDALQPDSHIHQWYLAADNPGYVECSRGQHTHGVQYDHVNKVFLGSDPQGRPLYKDVSYLYNS